VAVDRDAPGPLDGVVVADFSRVLAGPLATMLLADLGAVVVKVERPGTGDDTRAWGPTYFDAVNRGKRSVTLDLADPADRALARRLALRADVLVENFRPGTMERLGLGHEQLRAEHPRLVHVSVTGFGADAGAELPGYDFLVQAVGGLMSITGDAQGEPAKVGVALVDVVAGLFATVGVLAALRARDATGEGQRVEVDLLSSLLAALVNQASAFLATGAPPTRMGNAHPSIAPYETLRAADGPLAVAVGNDAQFARLCAVLGVAADARFATNDLRVAHRPELVAVLEAALAAGTVAEWTERLTAAAVPAGPVNDLAGAFALASRLGLGPVVDVGGVPQVANPIRLSSTPVAYTSPPPALGADDAAVRAWLLGSG
jgi:formyl-CoA transferase